MTEDNKAIEICVEDVVDVTELVAQLELAAQIIERQHNLLLKHGINPKEGQLVLPEGRVLRA